jgi:membrane protease subunit (stomatin/prohibitin family)
MSDMMQMMMGMGMAQNMMQNMQGSVGTPGQAAPATNTPDADAERAKILNTLKQLGELKEAGVLSEEEFNTKKAELLARL